MQYAETQGLTLFGDQSWSLTVAKAVRQDHHPTQVDFPI
jgi:hypothetical protein